MRLMKFVMQRLLILENKIKTTTEQELLMVVKEHLELALKMVEKQKNLGVTLLKKTINNFQT